MRTTAKLVCVFCVCLFSMPSSYAQIQIFSTGQVDMGVLSGIAPDPEFKINLSGKMRLSPTTSTGGPAIIIGHTEYTPPVLPQPYITGSIGGSLSIGLSNKRVGNVYASQLYSVSGTVQSFSDSSLKRNIINLESGLDKVLNLRSVRYDLLVPTEEDTPEEMRRTQIELGKNKVGFIAQEVKEFIPEVVRLDEEVGLYTMDYAALIPFLTKALQEQQGLIQSLQEKILNLELKLEAIHTLSPNVGNIENSSPASEHILYQNTPNPFNTRTQIKYSIAPTAKQARICIYNISGQQLKCIPIQQKGEGSVWIEGSDLQQGVYLYALLVDGNLVDMKKMILSN